jgi:hypothetical protein
VDLAAVEKIAAKALRAERIERRKRKGQ